MPQRSRVKILGRMRISVPTPHLHKVVGVETTALEVLEEVKKEENPENVVVEENPENHVKKDVVPEEDAANFLK